MNSRHAEVSLGPSILFFKRQDYTSMTNNDNVKDI